MAEQLKERWSSLSGKLKVGGAEVGKKVSTGMSSVTGKMKELFKVPTAADKLVEELTSEDILLSGQEQQGPDWPRIMALCDAIHQNEISAKEIVKALKKRLMFRNQPNGNGYASIDTIARIQLLTLTLIEACVKNCESLFIEISNQHVLDEMVKIVDDPTTPIVTRDKTLKMIEAWGESAPELRNLPMFEETYKSLKSRGVKFPLRDPESLAPIFTPPQSVHTSIRQSPPMSDSEVLLGAYEGAYEILQVDEILHTARNSVELLSTVLTSSPEQETQDELITTLVEQCRQSHFAVQRIAEQVGNDEAMLFEILNINDELQKVLSKYDEKRASSPSSEAVSVSEPSTISPTIEDNQSAANPEGARTAVLENDS